MNKAIILVVALIGATLVAAETKEKESEAPTMHTMSTDQQETLSEDLLKRQSANTHGYKVDPEKILSLAGNGSSQGQSQVVECQSLDSSSSEQVSQSQATQQGQSQGQQQQQQQQQ